jgi:hypothetical protein
VSATHSLKSGVLSVRVDGARVLTANLQGRVVKKVLFISVRKGSLATSLKVPPGTHRVEVEVRSDGDLSSDEIVGVFRSGRTEHLDVHVGGLLHALSLQWRGP